MEKFRFRSWQIYKDARNFRVFINRLMRTLPACERFGLIDQAQRASASIILNIAEGANKSTDKEMRLYLNRARCSVDEVVACLDCARDSSYIHDNQLSAGIEHAYKLTAQLSGFCKHLSKKK